MPEIGMSVSMSGDGKRALAIGPKLLRPSSTLPQPPKRSVRFRRAADDGLTLSSVGASTKSCLGLTLLPLRRIFAPLAGSGHAASR